MAVGSWMVACLLGVVHAGAAQDVLPYNNKQLEIPIRVVPERQQDIQSLELWMSTNQGKNWDLAATAQPTDTAFPFNAPTDGVYWFSVVVIDKQQRREPPDLTRAPVGLKVLVDTLPPDVRLSAPQRQGENIVVQWEIREENPDLTSFRLEYRNTDAVGDWVPVAVTPSLSGQTTVRVPHGALVRVQIKDQTGNERKSEELKVPGMGGAQVASTGGTPPGPAPSGPALGTGATTPTAPPTPPISSHPTEMTPPPVQPTPPGPARGTPPGPREWSPTPPVKQVTHQQGQPEQDSLVPSITGNGTNVIASSSPAGDLRHDLTGPAPSRAGAGAMPPVQVINQRRLSLEYEVSRYGPSGVGSVDLYVTRDDGQTWQKFPSDVAGASPGVEGKDGVMRRVLTVDLPAEGIYGFSMVVKSGAGLSKPAPRPGDAPQMRVELDAKLPDIKLYEPGLDPLQRNSLVIKWDVTDKNLATTPISLEWAEQPTGPWSPIGSPQMANSGSFSWSVPPTIPARVFLRLSARDTAGNVAIAETQRPVLVDLNTPEVKILGLAGPGSGPLPGPGTGSPAAPRPGHGSGSGPAPGPGLAPGPN